MTNKPYYIEHCSENSMPEYPHFMDKLLRLQKTVNVIKSSDIMFNPIIESFKRVDSNPRIKKLFVLGNIVWSDKLKYLILRNKSYPSEYFIDVILATEIIDSYICNPPIKLDSKYIDAFSYVCLRYNKLLIIDALMKQGSNKRYLVDSDPPKYVYSEHSGGISVIDGVVDKIVVATDTDRIDSHDQDIFLPVNSDILATNDIIFHTHPNASSYGGRYDEGIVYEFPSSSDLLNFVKYYNEGKAQASIIATPEGLYVIRLVSFEKKIKPIFNLHHKLNNFIIKLERKAVNKFKYLGDTIRDPDTFNKVVGYDTSFIEKLNSYIKPTNLFIEYYPRVKINNEWVLPQVNIGYIDKQYIS